jgi:hypothetical protein
LVTGRVPGRNSLNQGLGPPAGAPFARTRLTSPRCILPRLSRIQRCSRDFRGTFPLHTWRRARCGLHLGSIFDAGNPDQRIPSNKTSESVPASDRATSRASSCASRVTLRDGVGPDRSSQRSRHSRSLRSPSAAQSGPYHRCGTTPLAAPRTLGRCPSQGFYTTKTQLRHSACDQVAVTFGTPDPSGHDRITPLDGVRPWGRTDSDF